MSKLTIDELAKQEGEKEIVIDIKDKNEYQKTYEVYKSELDYLYDDNENNVDKANNETEIIEAEEVDTGKIDWDW